MDDTRVLWEHNDEGGRLQCLIRECCTGAELQLRRIARRSANAYRVAEDDAVIVLREVYPLKSDLYERAAELRPPRPRGPTSPE